MKKIRNGWGAANHGRVRNVGCLAFGEAVWWIVPGGEGRVSSLRGTKKLGTPFVDGVYA